jgi:hypothetical protein
VIVESIDRLSRMTADAARAEQELETLLALVRRATIVPTAIKRH